MLDRTYPHDTSFLFQCLKMKILHRNNKTLILEKMKSLVKMSGGSTAMDAHSLSQFSASTVDATVRLGGGERPARSKIRPPQAQGLLSFLQDNKLFPLAKFPLASTVFGNHSYNHSKKYLYSVCSMISKMNKIMKRQTEPQHTF